MKKIAVFGSSKSKPGSPAYRLAEEVGRLLAVRGCAVVNGGYAGVMEGSARGAVEAGGKAIGITTTEFPGRANRYLSEERKVHTWQDRVMALIGDSDGYVVLDGGTGTLVEFSVAVEMMNKGLVPVKPLVVYGAFWKKVKELLETHPEISMDFVKTADSAKAVIDALDV